MAVGNCEQQAHRRHQLGLGHLFLDDLGQPLNDLDQLGEPNIGIGHHCFFPLDRWADCASNRAISAAIRSSMWGMDWRRRIIQPRVYGS